MNAESPVAKRSRFLLSIGMVGILLFLNSWFFTAMCLMAGALIAAGYFGSWRDWFTWIGMLAAFSLFAGVRAGMGPMVEERPVFHYVIALETLGGLLPVASVWLQGHLSGGRLDALVTAVYISFFIVPQVVVVYLWLKGGPFPRYVAAAALLFGIALIVHLVIPTAPPWMAADEGLIPPLDRLGIRVLNSTHPTLTQGGYQASGNDVAAMPSVHQGLTVLAMIALAGYDSRTRLTGWAYSLAMLFAIAYLGEHYVVDGVAGALLAWGSWWMVGRGKKIGTGRQTSGTPPVTSG